MPIYEFRCEPCHHSFETLVRSQHDAPHCPKCGGIDLQKEFSVPAAAQTGQRSGGSLPICDTGSSSNYGCGSGPCGSGMCGLG